MARDLTSPALTNRPASAAMLRVYWRVAKVICFRPCDLTIALLEAWRGIGAEVRSELMRHAMAHQRRTIDALITMRAEVQP